MEQSQSADCSLLKPEWASLEPDEFRVLLEDRIGGPGQITGDSGFYLPLAGPNCQVVLPHVKCYQRPYVAPCCHLTGCAGSVCQRRDPTGQTRSLLQRR